MADFLTNLFTSIFTPGPTPTLIVATNASFAALQAVLLALLIATYSIHFLILSFLCGGLWASVNWFVNELEAAGAKEAENKRQQKDRDEQKGLGKGPDPGDADGSGTETEDTEGVMGESEASLKPQQEQGTASGLAPPEVEESVLSKRRSLGEASGGELSTDSEWDKVEDEGEEEEA